MFWCINKSFYERYDFGSASDDNDVWRRAHCATRKLLTSNFEMREVKVKVN